MKKTPPRSEKHLIKNGKLLHFSLEAKTCQIGPGDLKFSSFKQVNPMGGAVAEWCKALQLREKISENKKDPRFAPRPGQT